METVISLDRLEPGRSARIMEIDGESGAARRLREFGLIPGGMIRCRMRSAGGDPTAYEIRGTVIAIRREDAARIRVCRNDEAAAWD